MPPGKEHPPLPTYGFGFTENEKLFYRVNDERFRQMAFDERTTIHRLTIDGNNYGEFLFLTVSRPAEQGRECITFWGLGMHEYRDRWLVGEWFWHRSDQFPETMKQQLSKEETEELLQARQEDIAPYATEGEQSRRGQVFEMLADLTDEDGAYSELEDLGPLFWDDWED